VVEDKAVQAQALGVVLCHDGDAVETATTGAEALERAHGVPGPALVLLDRQLPDLSGSEVARRIRAASGVPIILLAARSGPATRPTVSDICQERARRRSPAAARRG
jgi:DNA-binding response OmpR family regulator